MSTSASCRIVVVSSTLETSRDVANRLKALSGDSSETQVNSEIINWTIQNKYYTAPVHFHPIHLEGLESIDLDDVPAIIYAWSGNEPFKVQLQQVAEHVFSYELEVSLAISLAPVNEEDLETFFFEQGFEYIDGNAPGRSGNLSDSAEDLALPGLNRALDALSTIMWPSMIRTESKHSTAPAARVLAAGMDDLDDVDVNLHALKSASSRDMSANDGKTRKQREMELLEEWLEADVIGDEDDNKNDDDYLPLSSHTHSLSNEDVNDPWATGSPLDRKAKTSDPAGFEDDFSEFVSAPGPSPFLSNPNDDAGEDSDHELPSKAEILAASERIFGSTPSSSSLQRPHQPSSMAANEPELESALDMDAPAFDLSSILDALQGMKEEIAQIPDEAERRKAAAKATLGLMYGLEGTSDDLDFEDA